MDIKGDEYYIKRIEQIKNYLDFKIGYYYYDSYNTYYIKVLLYVKHNMKLLLHLKVFVENLRFSLTSQQEDQL